MIAAERFFGVFPCTCACQHVLSAVTGHAWAWPSMLVLQSIAALASQQPVEE